MDNESCYKPWIERFGQHLIGPGFHCPNGGSQIAVGAVNKDLTVWLKLRNQFDQIEPRPILETQLNHRYFEIRPVNQIFGFTFARCPAASVTTALEFADKIERGSRAGIYD